MEQTFKTLQEEWEARVFQLDKVTLSDALTPSGKTPEYQNDRKNHSTEATFVIAGKRKNAIYKRCIQQCNSSKQEL